MEPLKKTSALRYFMTQYSKYIAIGLGTFAIGAVSAYLLLLISDTPQLGNSEENQSTLSLESLSNSTEEETFATVDKKNVTTKALNESYQEYNSLLERKGQNANIKENISTQELEKSIIGPLLEQKILYQYLDKTLSANDPLRKQIKDKCDKKQPNLQAKDELRCESELIEAFITQRIFNKISVSDQEALAYFQKNPKEFDLPERVQIRQIVLGTEDAAKKLRPLIRKDNFAQLAKEHSITEEKDSGGLIGPYSKTDLPQPFNLAFQMRIGEISDIIKSNYGFHFFLLEKKFPEGLAKFPEVKDKIKQKLNFETRQKALNDLLTEATKTVKLKAVSK